MEKRLMISAYSHIKQILYNDTPSNIELGHSSHLSDALKMKKINLNVVFYPKQTMYNITVNPHRFKKNCIHHSGTERQFPQ